MAPVVFGVILGTGVGGGIVIDGKVLTGANAIAGACLLRDSRGRKVGAHATAMVRGETGARQVKLDAALATAVAAVLVQLARHRVVPPLAGDPVGAGQYPAIDDNAAADAGAEDHAEHGLHPRAGAIGRLGQGEAVGVVGKSHFALQ